MAGSPLSTARRGDSPGHATGRAGLRRGTSSRGSAVAGRWRWARGTRDLAGRRSAPSPRELRRAPRTSFLSSRRAPEENASRSRFPPRRGRFWSRQRASALHPSRRASFSAKRGMATCAAMPEAAALSSERPGKTASLLSGRAKLQAAFLRLTADCRHQSRRKRKPTMHLKRFFSLALAAIPLLPATLLADPPAATQWVVTSAKASGGGNDYVSSLRIVNPNAVAAEVDMYFLPYSQLDASNNALGDNSGAQKVVVTVPGNSTLALDDVLTANFGATGSGGIRVEAPGSDS